MTSIEFDFSEMNAYSVELDASTRELAGNVVKAVKTSAFKGRKAWQAAARANSGAHLPAYPTAIDYDDVKNNGGVIETELGPNLAKAQGPLGIVEDSEKGVRGAPQRNYEKAEKVIESDLVIGVLRAVDDSLGGV